MSLAALLAFAPEIIVFSAVAITFCSLVALSPGSNNLKNRAYCFSESKLMMVKQLFARQLDPMPEQELGEQLKMAGLPER